MGLYRDDGLIIIWNPNGPKLDDYRKKIPNALKLLGFKITKYINLKINFLDFLDKGTYKPYKKDNDTPINLHTSSNHPPSITKQIPKSISRRLSRNTSNIDIFNKHKHIYDKALKHSGYRQALEFIPPKDKSKHRSRNIIWFNPPYNKWITSKIGRDFLNLISKHFTNNTPLAKIFNKNNIKVSYSCTNNMSQIIKNTTKKLYPPIVQLTPPTNAIIGSKAHAHNQKNVCIKTSYTKPR